jgi:CheY-like chemotaxis protein
MAVSLRYIQKVMKNRPAVLIVDDDASLRTLLSLLLRRAGYPTLTAASGPEALSLLATRPVGFMVTDGLMDAMDGFELSRRAKDLRPGLRIAMLSAMFGAHEARGEPIERVFEKPAALPDLFSWLREFSGAS